MKQALGKGLSALIDDSESIDDDKREKQSSISTGSKNDYVIEDPIRIPEEKIVSEVPIELITPCKTQPRKHFDLDAIEELATSIKENGLIQPIVVRRIKDATFEFEIVVGERRFRAASKLNYTKIPVIIREHDDKTTFEVALVENLQRRDLTPIEEAEGYIELQNKYGHNQNQISKITGKSRSHIANIMRLAKLPDEIKGYVNTGIISMGHARALINADDPCELVNRVIAEDLSVRDTERLVAGEPLENDVDFKPARPKNRKTKEIETEDEDIKALEKSITEVLGLKVRVKDQGGSGKVEISFNNLAELDSILERLV